LYRVPVTIFISTAPVEEGTYWWSYVNKGKRYSLKSQLSKQDLKRVTNKDRLLQIDALKKAISLKRDAMTIEQVKNASTSEYITIGGHTHNHPILINCTEKEVYDELEISKQKLESWTGKQVVYFAYPNGDYSKREMQILNELDYSLAYCSEPRYLTPDVLKDKYILPRFGFLEGASFAENICRMVGVWKIIKNRFDFTYTTKKRYANTSSLLLKLLGLNNILF
jgi:poly-beta-1,6-N-acetyl-D-glucosamine N-deacetylase